MNHDPIPTQTVLDGLDHLVKGGLTTQGIFDLAFAAKAKIIELSKNYRRSLVKLEVDGGIDNRSLYGDKDIIETVFKELSAPKRQHEKYLAFSGTTRQGQGWHGYRGAWPTKERCLIEILRSDNDWWHIIDGDTMQIVELG